jgi:flavin reductase (DIM6/NTAB) family NADH-FMN oxidoreductase RutF
METVLWRRSAFGNPLLEDTIAHFYCAAADMIDRDFHIILIGAAMSAHSRTNLMPLLFFRSALRTALLADDQ